MKRCAVIFFALLIFLSACAGVGSPFTVGSISPLVSVQAEEMEGAITYEVFYSMRVSNALHEPPSPLLGFSATWATERSQEDGLLALEATLGATHDAHLFHMHLGEAFPVAFMMACLVEQKKPVVVVQPPAHALATSWAEEIRHLAGMFGLFRIPMLVVFYPVPADTHWDAAAYISTFNQARDVFAELAPSAAFVWGVEAGLENFAGFYPGAAADWVGLSLVLDAADGEGDAFLRMFYHHFHQEKPVMLDVSVSHFTPDGHRYRVFEAAGQLAAFYQMVQGFPRVKLVNYSEVHRLSARGYDFRLHIDPVLARAYATAAADFLSQTQARAAFAEAVAVAGGSSGGANQTNQRMRSAFAAHAEEGRLYLDAHTITQEMGLPLPPGWRGQMPRSGSAPVPLDESGLQAHVCHETRQVYLLAPA